jgi:hypothetical protein
LAVSDRLVNRRLIAAEIVEDLEVTPKRFRLIVEDFWGIEGFRNVPLRRSIT